MEKKFYSPKEVQVILNVSRPHLYRLLKAGTIPSTCLGRRFLIPVAWVDALG
ncbi:helix-turn-helix domain-containing protein [Pelosinus sp. IPA-1]|uniref:helix-turn-helix domain-containing protein n=1 Tax=Pelosinus sp. IPA-1 TaxID=3029569 RepID=UPI0024362AD3|nr:helix-turn-helix domain-containing protein [Pelosinus sp. IPA-1]GMB00092.1 hypothetical protein PIPA1_28910 [Pelosinus sp. IPA-1]